MPRRRGSTAADSVENLEPRSRKRSRKGTEEEACDDPESLTSPVDLAKESGEGETVMEYVTFDEEVEIEVGDGADLLMKKNARRKGKARGAFVEKPDSAGEGVATSSGNAKEDDDGPGGVFIGEPVPAVEAMREWPHRYLAKVPAADQSVRKKQNPVSGLKDVIDDSEDIIQARCHYKQAEVDGITYKLFEDAHVFAGDGNLSYICQIVEMFVAVDGSACFTAQWYYRAEDTVIGEVHSSLINSKRVFFSQIRNDNGLDSLEKKLSIVKLTENMIPDAKKAAMTKCDYFCDMLYKLPYSTFTKLPEDTSGASSDSSSTANSAITVNDTSMQQRPKGSLLDLYSGCGAMSTGLCFGAALAGVDLVTNWAVDLNNFACASLKKNHPETLVRNVSVEDFLVLLKEWKNLCGYFRLIETEKSVQDMFPFVDEDDENDEDEEDDAEEEVDNTEIFEVERILEICYGNPNMNGKKGLFFKVQWKGYGAEYDSWEPITGLWNCRKAVKEFVKLGYESRILPLPGDVDSICGGPPCQGISGFNRYRNRTDPLSDPKNKQLEVFMQVVEYLRPKFVLMENVVDLLKLANGFLGRYALARLIGMDYQARLGMMAAGAYGLPQFRMRVFLWGALRSERLPQYPLPTHEVVQRGVIPLEFEDNKVAYENGHSVKLREKLLLVDAITDLPHVENDEDRDHVNYDKPHQTDFQKFIRLSKEELLGSSVKTSSSLLHDHFPLKLNKDDYERVCQIPKRKGANFRDLPGVRVKSDNTVELDPDVERKLVTSGKPLVPEYALRFVNGRSTKPFGRLWWDETVPTVVTRAEPHNQAILHPEQDRVLTIRENARLQGFPDFYELTGPTKERYMQVGNAVAVPVARALGYALGQIYNKVRSDDPVFQLPEGFPNLELNISSTSSDSS